MNVRPVYQEHDVCVFTDIFVFGDQKNFSSAIRLRGKDAEHPIRNVVFQNIYYNEKKLSKSELNIRSNEFSEFQVL